MYYSLIRNITHLNEIAIITGIDLIEIETMTLLLVAILQLDIRGTCIFNHVL